MRFYERRYRIVINQHELPIDYDSTKHLELSMYLDEVLCLFETTAYNTKQTAVISVHNWGKIALLNQSERNIIELERNGVELIKPSHLYADKIDVGIQMAFIAARVDMDSNLVEKATEGLVTKQGYLKLQEVFYDEYPEKFI